MDTETAERLRAEPGIETPAFVCGEQSLLENCTALRQSADAVGAKALYALKALSLPAVLRSMAVILDGFSASSLFEARLAREVAGRRGTVQLTSPGLRPNHSVELASLCDRVSFNSLEQLRRLSNAFPRPAQVGLRVNPRLSFAADHRFDPCTQGSRLGVPIGDLDALAASGSAALSPIAGLHFHNNCESEDFSQLHQTALRVAGLLRRWPGRIDWVNLGGGYYFPEDGVPSGLRDGVGALRDSLPDIEIYLEPGTSLVQDACVLVASVLDLIERDGTCIAILDTTTNHLPEVAEYAYTPNVLGADVLGRYRYTLAGCTCLAGDVLGSVALTCPLEVGSRVCLLDAGSYSIVKANAFNGIPEPSIYLVGKDGRPVRLTQPDYSLWRARNGAHTPLA